MGAQPYARWAVTAHLSEKGRGSSSLRAVFERRSARTPGRFGHRVRWCLSAPDAREHSFGADYDEGWLDTGRSGPEEAWLARPLEEMRGRGAAPAPERPLLGKAWIRPGDLRLGEHWLTRRPDGRRDLLLRADDALALRLLPVGRDGARYLVRGMMPGRRAVRGHALYQEQRGQSSPDRAGGITAELSFQDGSFVRFSADAGADAQTIQVSIAGPDGVPRAHEGRLRVEERWLSTRTYLRYPVAFELRVDALQLRMRIRAPFAAQELPTVLSAPPMWAGRVEVSGICRGRPFRGVGWVEQPAAPHVAGRGFFRAVHEAVRAEVAEVIGEPMSTEALASLSGLTDRSVHLEGVAPSALFRSLLEPVLAIIERGGKGWRSFTALACIDAVGGEPEDFRRWLAAPELIHVGSLVVDDVEDRSEVRRGGPTSHLIYGDPLAINAGSAAYFLAELALNQPTIAPHRAARVHREYFEAMRAGHAGQALDIANIEELAQAAAQTGETEAIERWVMAINRLKTAVPAGTPARMGAIAGGGTGAQVKALGDYFESVALAFQVVDDVLNLRGFAGDTKQRGEDLYIGKVTLPVIKAFARLPPEDRAWLWSLLGTTAPTREAVERGIALIDDCGALDACMDQAKAMVVDAWAALDPILPDSAAKLRIRGAGFYLLERAV